MFFFLLSGEKLFFLRILGSPQILICGESGGRSCFVDLAGRYRMSQSPCRTRSPTRNVLNADATDAGCSVLALSMREVFTYGADSIFVV